MKPLRVVTNTNGKTTVEFDKCHRQALADTKSIFEQMGYYLRGSIAGDDATLMSKSIAKVLKAIDILQPSESEAKPDA